MEGKDTFAKQAVDRWKSDTPPFFKKVARIGKYVAYIGGIITAGVTSVMTAGVAIPVAVPVILGAVTAMAATASATANLATEDQDIKDRQYPEQQ